MDRPTFETPNKHPIRAGGLLIYKITNNTLNFLMIQSNRGLEDFGGRTDNEDSNINDTIARETSEESNNVITKDDVHELINNGTGEDAYVPLCKYWLCIRESNVDYSMNDFGDYEICDNIQRNVVWIPYDDWKNHKINFRLQSGFVKKAINKILS